MEQLICLHGGPGIDGGYLRHSPLGRRSGTEIPDLAGHGEARDVEPSMASWMAAVPASGPVDVLGHSFGGFVALEAAIRFPKRIRRLFLVCTGPGPVAMRPDRMGSDEDVQTFFRARWPRFFSGEPDWRAFEASSFSAEAFNAGFHHALPRYDVRGQLAEVDMPVRLISGEHDGYRPAMEAMADVLPNTELHVMAGCGHMPFLEAPDAFMALLD